METEFWTYQEELNEQATWRFSRVTLEILFPRYILGSLTDPSLIKNIVQFFH